MMMKRSMSMNITYTKGTRALLGHEKESKSVVVLF
jgi:hypothetical protein